MVKRKNKGKVALSSRVKKKGAEWKRNVIDEVRKCVDQYENIFVFSHENVRSEFMKEIRLKWKKNRFFFSKNRIMAIGLGRTPAEEVSENLHLVSNKLLGKRGLIFSNASKAEIIEFFDSYKVKNFARTGNVATETFEIPEGLLSQFPHSVVPYFKKLGLPIDLKKGTPMLVKPFTVCKEGDILNPEQAKILKMFEVKLGHSYITIEFVWSKGGVFEDLGKAKPDLLTLKAKKKKVKSKSSSDGKEDSSVTTDNLNENGDQKEILSDDMEVDEIKLKSTKKKGKGTKVPDTADGKTKKKRKNTSDAKTGKENSVKGLNKLSLTDDQIDNETGATSQKRKLRSAKNTDDNVVNKKVKRIK